MATDATTSATHQDVPRVLVGRAVERARAVDDDRPAQQLREHEHVFREEGALGSRGVVQGRE